MNNSKTKEKILKDKLYPSIKIIDDPDFTFIKVLEAMQEYADQEVNQNTIKSLNSQQNR